MWVVKLGGSLMNSRYLPEWVTLLADHGAGKVILVPGGGMFANQVRRAQAQWHFDDLTAHQMALRAMEQYGLMLLSLEPRLCPASSMMAINDAVDNGKVPVWFPYDMVTVNHDIPASWDFTSDSLSLWLARQLNSKHLFLVKSIQPEQAHYSIDDLSECGMLDKGFTTLTEHSKIKLWWLTHDQIPVFHNMLCHDEFPENFKITTHHAKKNKTEINTLVTC